MMMVVSDDYEEVFSSQILKVKNYVQDSVLHYEFTMDGIVSALVFNRESRYSIQVSDDSNQLISSLEGLSFRSLYIGPTYDKTSTMTEVEFNESVD